MALFSIPGLATASNYVEDVYAQDSTHFRGSEYSPYGGVPLEPPHPSYPQEVVISCPNKKLRVKCPLGGALQLAANAEWEEMFGGGIGAIGGGILGTANNIAQWAGGQTMQQPWMNRKIYKNTKPFSFTLPLNFITPAGEDSCEWVAKPTIALLSLLYPRILKQDEELLSGEKAAGKMANATKGDKSSVGAAALKLLKFYAIPGPALRYDSEEASQANKGDSVNIMVGNMFNFGACYVTNVSVTYSEAFNEFGYPLAAKVSLQATCADQVVCENNGDFIVNLPPQHAAGLTEFLDACQITGDNMKKNVKNLFNAVTGFYKQEG